MNLLISKLPSPRDDDFSKGILDVIDLDSYRLEAQESMSIKNLQMNMPKSYLFQQAVHDVL